jgi:hypothetical protein
LGARFQSNRRKLILTPPEQLEDPKRALLTLAKTAPRKIRNGLLPEQGSNALIGPEYNDLLADYLRSRWGFEAASARFESSGSWLNFLHFSKSEALFQKPE